MRYPMVQGNGGGGREARWQSVVVWVVVLWVVFSFCRVSGAATAYYSFTGGFTNGTETQSFLFNLNSALRSGAPFTLRTWHHGGGTNAAGDVIAAGGFDPILRLYNNAPALIAENDDYNPPTVRDSQIDWATSGMPAQLPADNYQLNLVAYNNTLGGRTGNWAVDLVADAAKFTLTGVDKADGTGATTINSLTIGSDDVRLPAKVQIDPLESLSIAGPLIVGDTGSGEVTVTTGALNTDNGVVGYSHSYLGFEPGSIGNVTLRLGGSWSDNQGINTIGWQGEGNLRVESGALATFEGPFVLAEYGGSEGNVTVTGHDSHLVTNSAIDVGEGGTGYLRIENEGHVSSTGFWTVGADTVGVWGQGTVEVDGKDSLWSTGRLIVGYGAFGGPYWGQGIVRITNGGRISTAGNAQIGYSSYAHDSSVTLTGAAPDGTPATWQVSGNLHIAGDEFNPSNAANSKLTINPGGFVDVTGTTTVWNGGGSLELLSGELETDSLIVKPGATFTHTDGTLTINGGTFDPGTGTADYVITGADSADRPKVVLTNGADSVPLGLLIVGRSNHGELTVEAGSTLTTTNVQTALAVSPAASSGKITVRGAQSQLIITDPAIPGVSHFSLMVGTTGLGELSISNGGQVKVQQGGASLACCLGFGFGTGAITVEGSDSLLEAKYVDFRAVGGDSSVTIRDYGIVRTTDSSYYNVIAPLSHISSPTTVRVNITSGGRLELAGQLDIGGSIVHSDDNVHVSIDGSSVGQAALIVDGPLSIGKSTNFDLGPAQVTIANGGQVTADSVKVWQPGTIELNNGGINTGSLELAGGKLRGIGTVLVSGQLANAGVVSPGVLAPALSTDLIIVDGDYTQNSAGELDIEIGGTSPYDYDRLIIENGSASLHGKLAVSLIDTGGGTDVFQPNAGDMFEILIAANGLGGTTFATEILPALRGGLYFGVLYNPTDVTLVAAGVLGDYNRNGAVDAADYVVWRNTFSGPNVPASNLAADGDGDHDVDQGDFAVWRSHFGQTTASGLRATYPAAAEAGVPEPPALLLAALGLLMGSMRTRRREPRTFTRKNVLPPLLSVAICLVFSAAASLAAVVADVAADFSPTDNPNGAWKYGWSTSLTSALNLYPNYVHASNGIDVWQDNGHTSWGAPNIAHNGTSGVVSTDPAIVTWQSNQFSLHPGAGGEFSHAVWTSTVAGNLDLAGAFTGIDHTGTTSDVHILLNATPVFDGFVNGYGNTSSFSTTVTVGIGDIIDFAVGYGANYTFWDDSTALSATIAPGILGDYNRNGTVDAADYVVWRTNLNTNNVLPNDPIGGTIGPAHFDQWRMHFGQTAGSSAVLESANAADAIPEPSAILLLALGVSVCVLTTRRKRMLRNEIVRFADRR